MKKRSLIIALPLIVALGCLTMIPASAAVTIDKATVSASQEHGDKAKTDGLAKKAEKTEKPEAKKEEVKTVPKTTEVKKDADNAEKAKREEAMKAERVRHEEAVKAEKVRHEEAVKAERVRHEEAVKALKAHNKAKVEKPKRVETSPEKPKTPEFKHSPEAETPKR